MLSRQMRQSPSIEPQTLSEAESSVDAETPNVAEPTSDKAMQSDEEDNTSEDVPSHRWQGRQK